MRVSRQKCDKIANWLSLLAIPGWLVFFSTAAYDIYLSRTNPTSPDATHSVEQISHGTSRYYTPGQARICSYPFIGLAQGFSFLILATFVSNGCKFNKGIFSKRTP
jgi:hypothetical protein